MTISVVETEPAVLLPDIQLYSPPESPGNPPDATGPLDGESDAPVADDALGAVDASINVTAEDEWHDDKAAAEAIQELAAQEAAQEKSQQSADTAETFREKTLGELRTKVSQLAIDAAESSGRTKSFKKQLNAAVEELAEYQNWPLESLPLFDRKPADATSDATVADDTAALMEESSDASPNDSWRAITLESIGVPSGICKKLNELHEICTLGEIADWTSAGNSLTDLSGIGETKAAKITAALDRFWVVREN